MNDSSIVLEFNKIKNSLIEFSRLSFNNPKLDNIEILTDIDLIKFELEKTNEGIEIVNKIGQVNLDYIHDIKESLVKAYKGGILTPEQLYRISSQYKGIDQINSFYNALKDKIENYPHFVYDLNSLFILKDLSYKIDKVVSNDFSILDNASPILAKIRKDIINKNNLLRSRIDSLAKRNSEYLMDNIVTIRNDRYVIPVKNAYKNMVKGIIHDESSSNASVFIEPEEIVVINNEISNLKIAEKEEIERLLKYLSKEVSDNYSSLKSNLEHIIDMDYILAKGAYGISYDGMVANLSNNQQIILEGARHPLIDKKKIVANSFNLNSTNRQCYLITGPNTGGKTVALKTVGLLVLMNQAGLAIPTNKIPTLGVFNDVFVDIGDDQNISESLSTFSSHLSKLVYMVNNCDDKSLILVDEIGGGTDPSEGEALAMALIDTFHNKHCLIMATTHYHNLKTFGLENDYIVNCSMSFDMESLKPTYKLIDGTSGKSFAFEIASSLNLDEKIINKAKDFKNKFSDETDKRIEKLEIAEIENNALKEKYENLVFEANEKLKEANSYKKALELQKEKIKEDAKLELDKMIKKYQEELDNIYDEIKSNDNIKLHNVIEAKTKIKELFKDEIAETNNEVNHEFKVGDYVKIENIDKTGIIEKIENNTAFISVNGMSLKSHLSKLTYVKINPKDNNKIKINTHKEVSIRSVSPEINLLGLTVEEAKYELDKYLDSALRVNMKTVRIIHGYGTGRLKAGIWEYLKTKKFIKEFHYAGQYDGGMGATIVEFK